MANFVLGFARDETHIVLMRGNGNFFDGARDEGETPEDMARVFEAHTGLKTQPESWRKRGELQGAEHVVHVYAASLDSIQASHQVGLQMPIRLNIQASHLRREPLVPHIEWLVPLVFDEVTFEVQI